MKHSNYQSDNNYVKGDKMIFDGALSLIGNTPMVRLERLGYPNVYVKL